MTSHRSDLAAIVVNAIRPRSRVTVSEWSDRHRMLTTGSEKGRWKTDRTPYLREPMDCLSVHSPVEQVVMIKGSQLGASEGLVNNWVGYVIEHAPCSMLIVQPDVERAERYSKQRIAPMIAATPSVRELVAEQKMGRDSGGNTIQDKQFVGGSLTILGANAPAGLASMPICYLACDEVDRFKYSAGTEGDPIDLAVQRTNTFPRRKILLISSPGEKSTSRIEPAYELSDQREYHLPCPFCGHLQILNFKRLRWEDGKPRTAVYHCSDCDCAIDERHKTQMLALGQWVPRHPEREVRGYKISALYSPWLRWHEVASRFIAARGRPQRLKVFVNTILGESWDTHAETKVEPSRLDLLRIAIEVDDGIPVVPLGVGILTAGVDVQQNRLEVGLYGWGRGEECWHIDYRVIAGDPSASETWTALEDYLLQAWRHASGLGITLTAACVDTGGHHTQKVYDFVRSRNTRGVWGIKGIGGQGKRLWPRTATKTNKGKIDLFLIGVDTAKMQIYARIKATLDAADKGEPIGGPGHVHIAEHIAEPEYLAGLVSEVPVTTYKRGHPVIVWDLPGQTRNEPLDCAVYGYAALVGWKVTRGKRVESAVERMHPAGVASGDVVSFRSSKVSKLSETPKPAPGDHAPARRSDPPQATGRRPRWE